MENAVFSISNLRYADEIISRNSHLILWNKNAKVIPKRPENPEAYPEDDERHWYDMEYAGWDVEKLPMPESRGDGPAGKRVVCILPGHHLYFSEYEKSMHRVARNNSIQLKTVYGDWTSLKQKLIFFESLKEKPDFIIFVPVDTDKCVDWVKKAYELKIPVIVSTTMPSREVLKYALAWTGADAWGEFRMLARKMAEFMNYRGNYCIIRHMPGLSAYYSRTYSILTELKKIAPSMHCLAMETTYLNEDLTEKQVLEWIDTYGNRLNGLVAADDHTVMKGVVRALEKRKRYDIIVVSNGSTETGIRLIQENKLHAMNLKSPSLDGAVALQTAIDWFNNLKIEPIIYLPKHIITREDVEEFDSNGTLQKSIDYSFLEKAIKEKNFVAVEIFYSNVYSTLINSKVMSLDYFRGISIEIVAHLIQFADDYNINFNLVFGDYEMLFKNLFKQKTVENTLKWLEKKTKIIVTELVNREKDRTSVEKILDYIEAHLSEPLCLKTLAWKFRMSSTYIGQAIKKKTGMYFTDFLNKLRIEKAIMLFQTTSLQAKEIGKRVGFSNPDYFYQIFKKITGKTTTQFLKELNNTYY